MHISLVFPSVFLNLVLNCFTLFPALVLTLGQFRYHVLDFLPLFPVRHLRSALSWAGPFLSICPLLSPYHLVLLGLGVAGGGNAPAPPSCI